MWFMESTQSNIECQAIVNFRGVSAAAVVAAQMLGPHFLFGSRHNEGLFREEATHSF